MDKKSPAFQCECRGFSDGGGLPGAVRPCGGAPGVSLSLIHIYLEDIQNGSLPVYGKAVSPLGPYHQGPGEMNVPVVCGGQVVMPGDILVGDRDGIVVIPRQEAAELLEAARKNLQDEQEAMARMKAGTFPVEEHLLSLIHI